MRLPAQPLPPDLIDALYALPPDGTPGIIYLRISRDRDHDYESEANQLWEVVPLARRMGVRVLGVYLDNDVSATTGSRKRRDYYEMIDFLAGDSARVVLSWHSDRMHRNPRELEDFIDVCEPRGILTHTVRSGTMDFSTAVGQAAARTYTAWAQAAARQTSERLQMKFASMRRAGKWTGGIRPYGWEADGVSPRPEEIAEIVWGTRSIIEGESLRTVARGWRDRGTRGTRGGEWTATTVRQVLLRARNAGFVTHKGEIIGKGGWVAAVTEEEWRACVDMIERRGQTSSWRTVGRPAAHLGSALYVCGGCGQPEMRVAPLAKGKGKPKYVCAPRTPRRVTGVPHVSRQAESLDEYVQEAIVARLSREDAVELLRRPDGGETVDVAALHGELARLQSVLASLAEDYADGVLTRSAMLLGTERARHRMTVVGDELSAAAEVDPLAAVVGTDVRREWFGDEAAGVPGYSLERRRAILRRLVDVWIMPSPLGRRGPDFRWWEYIELRWKD